VRPLAILLTAAGSPGTAALVRALRENGERDVRIIGVDMNERSVGAHLCDSFSVVPASSDPAFIPSLARIVEQEGVDLVIPQSSFDLPALAAARDDFAVRVLVSSAETVRRSNDKAETYALLRELGVAAPDFRRVRGAYAVGAAATELGYPERDVAVKPVFSSGSRGFRVLSAGADRREQLLTNRPGVAEALRLEELEDLLGGAETELLVMELATGGERTIDGIADGRRIVLGHPKTRESLRAGLAMYFVTLEDGSLMTLAKEVVAALAIEHFFNIQLVGDHVIEVNPRISTIVYQEDLNIPYLGVKHALGEISDEELVSYAARIRPGRTALRYFDQLEWDT